LINEAALLRRLLNSDNPRAPRMRRWLTHELLPALQRRQEGNGELQRPNIDAIRRQTAAEVLRGADEIIHLIGVSHSEALLSVLEEIQAQTSPTALEGQQRVSRRAVVAWLTSDELADRLDRSLRHTNQRLATAGLQQRNEDDDWQLTEAGRDWGVTQPLCSRGEHHQQILWDPAVVALLHQTD
jgi:prophage antirepressor-like protein